VPHPFAFSEDQREMLRAEAERFMVAQDVRNVVAFLRVLAPGFPD